MSKKSAQIYTDGACSRNGQSGASMGTGVYWPDAPQRNISQPYHSSRASNQMAELEAARQGIEQCKNLGYDKVTVHTDSHYVQKGATEWMPRWEQRGYSDARGNPVVNETGFRNLKSAMDGIDVEFKYVPSGQNHADSLAKDGARRR